MVIWIVPQEVLTVKISWTLYGKHTITSPLAEIAAECFIVYKYHHIPFMLHVFKIPFPAK